MAQWILFFMRSKGLNSCTAVCTANRGRAFSEFIHVVCPCTAMASHICMIGGGFIR
jgi:hypothetical protein